MEKKTIKILLVEDNPDDVFLLTTILKDTVYSHFQIKNAQRMKQAASYLKEEAFDVAILDLELPDSHGLESLEMFQTMSPDIPVVVLTILDDTETALQAIRLGAQDYLAKGHFDTEVFERTIRYAIERKQLELKLLESNQSKDKLISIISHDLRTPFTTLTATIEFMLMSLGEVDEKTLKKKLGNLKQSIVDIYDLLENLLKWAETQSDRIRFQPGEFNLHDIAYSAITICTKSAKQKSISITNDVPRDILVYVDPQMIDIALRNLISNGVKFTPDDGEIRVAAETRDNMVEVAVTDTGVGIKKNNLKKLFHIDSRHSTKGTDGEKGTGFGLIITQEFIKKNGGTIRVESETGKGSTFKFTLPLPQ